MIFKPFLFKDQNIKYKWRVTLSPFKKQRCNINMNWFISLFFLSIKYDLILRPFTPRFYASKCQVILKLFLWKNRYKNANAEWFLNPDSSSIRISNINGKLLLSPFSSKKQNAKYKWQLILILFSVSFKMINTNGKWF